MKRRIMTSNSACFGSCNAIFFIDFHQEPPRTIWQGPRWPLHKWPLLKSVPAFDNFDLSL